MPAFNSSPRVRGLLVINTVLLAACESKVTTDLATDAPADPNVSRVEASLIGVEFQKSDGGTETLEFSDSEPVNFMDYLDGDAVRLFTDEELPQGRYNGVRLFFDENETARLVLNDGREFPITLSAGNYAPLDFAIDDNSNSSESFVLNLDLRQSLSFDDGVDEYTLQPVLRAVGSGEAAQIQGIVTVPCILGGTVTSGGAVYLYQGEDVTPDDRDNVGVEPFATTRLVLDFTGGLSYTLRYLPAGNYTIALTCKGDLDDASLDEDLDFQNAAGVQLDVEESLIHNFTG